MEPQSLRRSLYEGTRDLHEKLDQAVGSLSSADEYHAYLRGTYLFRQAIEPLLCADGWSGDVLVPAMKDDLTALGQPVPPALSLSLGDSAAMRLAALYVTEGSAIGGRVLVRRAAALGFTGIHGASHLALQTTSRERWPRFLDWLAAQEVSAADAVVKGRQVFELAMQAHRVDA
jgi:heme oxygenase